MSDTVDDPADYALAYCRKHGVPERLWEDAAQEAWGAALEHGGSKRHIRNAIDRLVYAEAKAPMPFTDATARGLMDADDAGNPVVSL